MCIPLQFPELYLQQLISYVFLQFLSERSNWSTEKSEQKVSKIIKDILAKQDLKVMDFMKWGKWNKNKLDAGGQDVEVG